MEPIRMFFIVTGLLVAFVLMPAFVLCLLRLSKQREQAWEEMEEREFSRMRAAILSRVQEHQGQVFVSEQEMAELVTVTQERVN